MRHKRLKLSAVLLLVLGLTGVKAQTMYVNETSSSQTAYSLDNIRKITFSTGNVTILKTDLTEGVYALGGLSSLSFEDVVTGLETKDETIESKLLAYPNPVVDLLTIELSGVESTGTISILDLSGKVVRQQKISSTERVTVNVSQLPKGIYLCSYTNATESKTIKIIKQ